METKLPDPCILIVDGDILLYEYGFGLESVQDFWIVEKSLDGFFGKLQNKFKTFDVEVYLTGKNNFREGVAVTKEYKGSRKHKPKPKWYKEIKEYLIQEWDAYVIDGMEADDILSIRLTEDPRCICCSRDKDLKQVPGWHYSWGTSRTPVWGPKYIDEHGFLELDAKGQLKGGGNMFLYAQMLMGDIVDDIVGLPGYGATGAYQLLKHCETKEELHEIVQDSYTYVFGKDAETRFLENMNLLFMIRELDEKGEPMLWEKRDENGTL